MVKTGLAGNLIVFVQTCLVRRFGKMTVTGYANDLAVSDPEH